MLSPLTAKQEIFCIKYFETRNATQSALFAKYSPKTAYIIGHENLRKPKIISRLNELKAQAKEITPAGAIASVEERKEILSEISRGRLADFITGVTPEKLKSAALRELKVTELVNKDFSRKITTVQLHNPIAAIAELNKMDGVYREGVTVNVDNRKLEIVVSSPETRELLGEIEKGIEPHQEEK